MLYMKQITISSKNQITLPAELLRKRGLAPGQKLYVATDGEDITLTTRSPLRRIIDEARTAKPNAKQSKKLVDPLKERQKLRKEWNEREKRYGLM